MSAWTPLTLPLNPSVQTPVSSSNMQTTPQNGIRPIPATARPVYIPKHPQQNNAPRELVISASNAMENAQHAVPSINRPARPTPRYPVPMPWTASYPGGLDSVKLFLDQASAILLSLGAGFSASILQSKTRFLTLSFHPENGKTNSLR